MIGITADFPVLDAPVMTFNIPSASTELAVRC